MCHVQWVIILSFISQEAPFGQGPYLEYNGKKYGQSIAIASFLAREFGKYISAMDSFVDRLNMWGISLNN